jgi:hypothetical protein
MEPGLRIDYSLSQNLAFFVSETGDLHRYDLRPPVSPLNRNSVGSTVVAGSDFRITHLLKGEIGIGYLETKYAEPGAPKVSGLAVDSKLVWYATPLISATLVAARAVHDSGLTNTPAYVDTTFGVEIDYELLRNLIIIVKGRRLQDEFIGIDRHDIEYNAAIHATYLLNRGIGIGMSFSSIRHRSIGPEHGVSFDDNRLGIELTVQR